ncbi:glycosyltransferase [Leptonema illini]|uniref:Glycosyl transferase family 2 n=1 Tax=Leptonema illini DSM 21528 TaxID=929563 RepID=H2CD44_9LEPT|nr:glycosyltransferase [Leptonema illini]EHQ07520.1 glycosyl transferase family 2 [Leptonema illini DSM 21528]
MVTVIERSYMPKVSVIIPSYKHGKYVRESIRSVLSQTFQDFEIVVTDDGSTDNTVEEIKSFNDERIKLFVFSKNQGASVAANNCILNSSGKYIAMLSSDDVFFPGKLEKQVEFLDGNPDIGVVFSKAYFIDEDGDKFTDLTHPYCSVFNKENRDRYQWLNYFFYHGNCLCHPSALIRRDCYDKVGLYDERFGSLPDFDFWVRVCMHFDIHILNENLIKFRIRKGEANASGDKPETHIRNTVEYKEILKHYLNIESVEDFRKIFSGVDIPGQVDAKLIPFYVAKESLASPLEYRRLFGIEVLYDIMKEKDIAKSLNEIGFAYSDLIAITGKHDVFKLYLNGSPFLSKKGRAQYKIGEFILWLPYRIYKLLKAVRAYFLSACKVDASK